MATALDKPAGREDTDLIDPVKLMAKAMPLTRTEAVWIAPSIGRIKITLAAARTLEVAEPIRPQATAGKPAIAELQVTCPAKARAQAEASSAARFGSLSSA